MLPMKPIRTYRTILHATAILLLIGVTIPSGLHAKALIDYCFSTTAAKGAPMQQDHSCCLPDRPDETSGNKHDCEWETVCTCHIEPAPLSELEWTAPKPDDKAAELPVQPVSLSAMDTAGEDMPMPAEIYRSGPPLWLMNATLLN